MGYPGVDDCNGNDIRDECDLANGTSQNCNGNAVPDECDIAGGASDDANGDGRQVLSRNMQKQKEIGR